MLVVGALADHEAVLDRAAARKVKFPATPRPALALEQLNERREVETLQCLRYTLKSHASSTTAFVGISEDARGPRAPINKPHQEQCEQERENHAGKREHQRANCKHGQNHKAVGLRIEATTKAVKASSQRIGNTISHLTARLGGDWLLE